MCESCGNAPRGRACSTKPPEAWSPPAADLGINRHIYGLRDDERAGHQHQAPQRLLEGRTASVAEQHDRQENGRHERGGMSARIGPPRFAIIVWPMSKNVSGRIDAIDGLRLNHVPPEDPHDKSEEQHVHELSDAYGSRRHRLLPQ
jgi:hypothetical protein